MTNTKFIADWNDIFEFKIKEADLQNPTEAFVFNVLLHYLKKFNMDVAALINQNNCANADKRRLFKIKFCAYIDHIYKLSCATNNFVYLDLIRPSFQRLESHIETIRLKFDRQLALITNYHILAPKKTTHMLKILLNYFLYVEMLKKETIGMAEAKIKERNRLVDKKSKYQVQIETYKSQLDMLKKTIAQHTDIIPKLTGQIAKLSSTEKEQADKIAQLQDNVRNYDSILSQLRCKEEELKCDIVSDEEIESLGRNKALLEQAIIEQEELAKINAANNKERVNTINKMLPAIEKIDSVIKNYPVKDLQRLKEMKIARQQTSQKYTEQKVLNEEKKRTIQHNIDLINKYEEIIAQKKGILASIMEKAESEIGQINRNIENEKRLSETLDAELQSLEKELKKHNDYSEYLLESIQLIVGALLDI